MDGCQNCTGAITSKLSKDEQIVEVAKNRAKETGKSVGLYRDETGQLCIATGDKPVCRIITPNMQ